MYACFRPPFMVLWNPETNNRDNGLSPKQPINSDQNFSKKLSFRFHWWQIVLQGENPLRTISHFFSYRTYNASNRWEATKFDFIRMMTKIGKVFTRTASSSSLERTLSQALVIDTNSWVGKVPYSRAEGPTFDSTCGWFLFFWNVIIWNECQLILSLYIHNY